MAAGVLRHNTRIDPTRRTQESTADQLRPPNRVTRTRGPNEPGHICCGHPGQVDYVTAHGGRDARPRDVDVAAHGAFGQAALRKQWSR